MLQTFQALRIFLLLLPGFVSSAVYTSLVSRRPLEPIGRVVEALVFSFITYTTLSAMGLDPANRWYGFVALILASLIPLPVALIGNRDGHMALLRRLGITRETSRTSTWLEVFMRKPCYIYLNLRGGRRLFGWPKNFSNDPDERMIYLQDARWIMDGEFQHVGSPGLLVVDGSLIESIMFSGITKENAEEEEDAVDKTKDVKQMIDTSETTRMIDTSEYVKKSENEDAPVKQVKAPVPPAPPQEKKK